MKLLPNERGRRLHLMSSLLLLRPYESTNTPNSDRNIRHWAVNLPGQSGQKEKDNSSTTVWELCRYERLTMETEQVFILLRRRGDLDDGDGEAVGGCGEDGRCERHIVFIQELCGETSRLLVSRHSWVTTESFLGTKLQVESTWPQVSVFLSIFYLYCQEQVNRSSALCEYCVLTLLLADGQWV